MLNTSMNKSDEKTIENNEQHSNNATNNTNSEHFKADYLEVTTITRPICSIYELAGTITALSRHIYDDDSLDQYVNVPTYNYFINPTLIATNALGLRNDEFCYQNNRDALLDRTTENVKFSDLYKIPSQVEELNDYLTRQYNMLKTYTNSEKIEDDNENYDLDEEGAEFEGIGDD